MPKAASTPVDDGRSESRESTGGRRCTRRESGVSRHRGLVRARHGRSEANDQLPRRSESARAVQVRLGLAEVSRRLREPLDAAGNQHDGRHRVVENRRRSFRRRTPHRQAQPRLLLDRRFAGGEQPGARDLSADHEPGVSPIPAATGVRRSDSHARVSIRDPVARHGRRRDLQHVPRGAGGRAQGVVGVEVHARSVGSDVHDRHARNRQGTAEEPDRVLLRARRHLLLLRLHADSVDGSPQQDDRHVGAVPVHPARRIDARELRHRRDQPDQIREPAACGTTTCAIGHCR